MNKLMWEGSYNIFIIFTILLMASVFFFYDVLLFTEANNWFFSMYVAGQVLDGATDIYKIGELNTPNSLFIYVYLYLRDVFFFVDEYILMKSILFMLFISFIFLVNKLIQIKEIYSALLPISRSYILVGGMVNYYFGLVLVLLFVYLVEKYKKINFIASSSLILLIYHAHFMALFPLMIYVVYKYGIKYTFLLSIMPALLLLTYKLNHQAFYIVGGDYGFINHILSIRRVLLPSLVDTYYYDRVNQYILSSLINLFYLVVVSFSCYITVKEQKGITKLKRLFVFLVAVYFLLPASLPGSGLNIHERLIVPFFIFIISEVNINRKWFKCVFSFITLLTAANLLYSQDVAINETYRIHSEYTCDSLRGHSGHDLKTPITNRAPIGRSVYFAEKMLNGDPVDEIIIPKDTMLFAASIAKYKSNNPYIDNGGC